MRYEFTGRNVTVTPPLKKHVREHLDKLDRILDSAPMRAHIILEIEKHRKLSYSWVVGDFLDTVVTFTLTPTDTGTRLLLVQSGFTQKQNAGGARYGWKLMGARLEDLLGRMS